MATKPRRPFWVISGGKTNPPDPVEDPEPEPGAITLTRIAPNRLARTGGPVVVTFTGTGFQPGMELEVHREGNEVLHYLFNNVTSVSATLLWKITDYPDAEILSLRVENPDGGFSNSITLRIT